MRFVVKKLDLVLYYILSLLSSFYINFTIINLTYNNLVLDVLNSVLMFSLLILLSIRLARKKKLKKIIYWTIILMIFFFLLLLLYLNNSNFFDYKIDIFQASPYIILFKFDSSVIYYFFFLVIIILFLILAEKYKKSSAKRNRNLTLIHYLIDNPKNLNVLFLFFLISTLTLSEELVFRYFLINLLTSLTSFNMFFIVIIISFLFSFLHLLNFRVFNIDTIIFFLICFYCSILFSTIFLSNGILFAWLFHYLFNCVLLSIDIFTKKLSPLKISNSTF